MVRQRRRLWHHCEQFNHTCKCIVSLSNEIPKKPVYTISSQNAHDTFVNQGFLTKKTKSNFS